MKNTSPHPFSFLLFTLIFILFSACENPTTSTASTATETDGQSSPAAEAEVDPGAPAIVCVEPPNNLPSLWSEYIYPNCFQNIDRLGLWTGSDTVHLKENTDPSQYFTSVAPLSIGSVKNIPTHLYVVVHGWAPGLRAAAKHADGNIQWWGPTATDDGNWESAWAWIPTNGQRDQDIQVSPTGLLQQIEYYESQLPGESKPVVLAYSWVDNSATIMTHGNNRGTWEEAAYSEAYTNLNGFRLADAIQKALSPSFTANPQNKIHLIGHSHGTKVATVAALELINKGIKVNHLTTCDSPEAELPLSANAGNLLGFYFNLLPIAPVGQVPLPGQIFVESYVSMFGYGYDGPAGSSLKNVIQIGLDSEDIFEDDNFTARHAYSATWYSNAWNATTTNSWPSLGLGWPTSVLPTEASYYQDVDQVLPGDPSYASQQWHLIPGEITKANRSVYGYSYYTNPSLPVTLFDKSSGVSGSADTTLIIPARFEGQTTTQFYKGEFAADTDDLYGISFDLKWEGAQPDDYIIVTVQSPGVDTGPEDQIIALVIDGSASLDDGNWHPLSFNTSSPDDRKKTQFVIHYYPGTNVPNHPGVVSVTEFRNVSVEYDY